MVPAGAGACGGQGPPRRAGSCGPAPLRALGAAPPLQRPGPVQLPETPDHHWGPVVLSDRWRGRTHLAHELHTRWRGRDHPEQGWPAGPTGRSRQRPAQAQPGLDPASRPPRAGPTDGGVGCRQHSATPRARRRPAADLPGGPLGLPPSVQLRSRAARSSATELPPRGREVTSTATWAKLGAYDRGWPGPLEAADGHDKAHARRVRENRLDLARSPRSGFTPFEWTPSRPQPEPAHFGRPGLSSCVK